MTINSMDHWFEHYGRKPEFFGFEPRGRRLGFVAGFGSGEDRHRIGMFIEPSAEAEYREYFSSLGAREDSELIADKKTDG